MEQLSIIIVNWNTGTLLAKCISSLIALPEFELIRNIVIVDNASTDTSLQDARSMATREGFTFLPQQQNLGFAKANNIAWEYIQHAGGEHDHILLLNPDTEVLPGALSAMINILQEYPEAGIVGPKLLESKGDIQHSVRQFPSFGVILLLFLKLHLLFSKSSLWKTYTQQDFDYSKIQMVDQVMGAVFLIRNTVVQHIGLFDEAFWIWFEEVDYCKRAKQAGWSTIYTPTATVVHHGGTSFSQKIGIAKTKPLLDSALVYTRKHVGIFAFAILLVCYPVAILIALASSLAHMKQRLNNSSRL
jgi:N-acetylglucosaminyl-diphospho-decaprenol L-rhamnosyltransferase